MARQTSWIGFMMVVFGMARTHFLLAGDASCIGMWVVAFGMAGPHFPSASKTSWVGFRMGVFGKAGAHFQLASNASCIGMQVVAFSMGVAHSLMAGETSWLALVKPVGLALVGVDHYAQQNQLGWFWDGGFQNGQDPFSISRCCQLHWYASGSF